MNQTALCPSCKQEVVFDTTGDASVCPACGARFELTNEVTRHKRTRPVHVLIFLAWMFAPAAVALLTLAMLSIGKKPQGRDGFADYPAVFITLLTLSCISCYAACSWLMSRFTDKVWVRVVVGLCLGAALLVCNLIIALFGSCAITGGFRW